ncbi:hypothetical protein INR49_021604 [Caranx melampygus]|nr:hypothetical protein INR49_021604 [Caranx melampygus]
MDKTGVCSNSRNKDNVDLLREMGGVAFVYNLSKSSIVHCDVKEAALFTLGTLLEANVYCKNSLCRKETFADLGRCLMKEDNPLTQKRVSVYLLSVLVANNKLGQTLAQNTGCLDILLDLFRTTFPLSIDSTSVVANPTHLYQLWTSVSNALCGCVNNPQNAPLASGLAKYGIVSHLVSLLTCPNLNPVDRISVLLILGHCTEASVEHQSQLVQCGGLPLIITLLAEDTCEEVRKTATFILQTCKHATTAFGVRDLIAKHGEDENTEDLTNMENFKSSAKELLNRIDLLEKKQAKLLRTTRKTRTQLLQLKGELYYLYLESYLQRWSVSKTLKPTPCPFFKPSAPLRYSVPKEITCTYPEELHNPEMRNVTKFTAEEHLLARSRCAGCVLPFVKVTSRTFASLQTSCRHSCEMHKALQEATEQFRTRHCSLLLRRKYQDNSGELTRQNSESVSATEPQRSKEHWRVKEVSLTPIRKVEDKGKSSLPAHNWKKHKGRRRRRKNFSLEEVRCLLSGVKRFGSSWNSILWSYPFQPGRTNVDLAKKYKQLMRSKTQDAGCK